MRFIAAQRSGPIKSEIHPERISIITFKESVYIYLLLIPRLRGDKACTHFCGRFEFIGIVTEKVGPSQLRSRTLLYDSAIALKFSSVVERLKLCNDVMLTVIWKKRSIEKIDAELATLADRQKFCNKEVQ